MVSLTSISIISYSKISVLIFPTSYNLSHNFFPTSYPITENELGHTGPVSVWRDVTGVCVT